MGLVLRDAEICNLLAEKKDLPANWRKRLTLKPKRGHKERECDLRGESGNRFRLILRQADSNPLDFSVILGFIQPQSTQVFRLLRTNGKSHEHTNRIEGETFYEFHIHRATERYQAEGFPEDGYAKVTDTYSDLEGALRSLFEEANCVSPPDPQGQLPFGGG